MVSWKMERERRRENVSDLEKIFDDAMYIITYSKKCFSFIFIQPTQFLSHPLSPALL